MAHMLSIEVSSLTTYSTPVDQVYRPVVDPVQKRLRNAVPGSLSGITCPLKSNQPKLVQPTVMLVQ